MIMLRRVPIRLRLTLWYVILLGIILAVFIAGVYLMLRQSLYYNLDESMLNRANALLSVIQYEEDRLFLPIEVPLEGQSQDSYDEYFVRLFNASGNLRFNKTGDLERVPFGAAAVINTLRGESITRRVKVSEDEYPVRVKTLPIIRDGEIVGVLEVGQSEEDVSDTLTSLLQIMILAYPIVLLAASFDGVFLAGRALSPIDNITRAARQISAEGLNQRLNLRLPDDEVGRLARTFDEMIARLDGAFQRQRQFTADASHELRTPLTIIKGQIDVSLQRDREPEAYRQVLQGINAEVDRLIRLTGSLLTLTHADAGQIPLRFEDVDVAEAVIGVFEQIRPAAIEKGIECELDPGPPVTIQGDQDLLLQLMLNLSDNAIRYTPSGGQVTLGWRVNKDQVQLWVQDTGVGISQEHLPYLFDRFYRVDKARSRAEGGVGLGLAISRWIADAHQGSIHVESAPGKGSTFTVLLPAKH
jgi:heavy metal sensor kinase